MGGAGPLRGGTAFVWRNPRCPVRMRVAGGVIFEGRADKPLGVVGDKPYPGRDKFRQNVRRRGKFLRCALRGGKSVSKNAWRGAGARGRANKPCIASETSPARSLSKGQRKTRGAFRLVFCYNTKYEISFHFRGGVPACGRLCAQFAKTPKPAFCPLCGTSPCGLFGG